MRVRARALLLPVTGFGFAGAWPAITLTSCSVTSVTEVCTMVAVTRIPPARYV